MSAVSRSTFPNLFGLCARSGFATAVRSPSSWLAAVLVGSLLVTTPGIQFRTRSHALFAELTYSSAVVIGVCTSLLVLPSILDRERRFGVSFRHPRQPSGTLGIGSFCGVIAFVAIQIAAVLLLASPFQRGSWGESLGRAASGAVLGLLASAGCVLMLMWAAERLPRPVLLVLGLLLIVVTLDPAQLPEWSRALVFPVSPSDLSADESARVLPPRWIAAGLLYDLALVVAWGALASRTGARPR